MLHKTIPVGLVSGLGEPTLSYPNWGWDDPPSPGVHPWSKNWALTRMLSMGWKHLPWPLAPCSYMAMFHLYLVGK